MKFNKLKVLLVDDHKIVTEGLALLLNSAIDCSILAELNSGEKAVEFVRKNEVDLVFMDLIMPGRINGFNAISQIKTLNPKVKIIVLTMLSDAATIRNIMLAGANGFTIKNTSSAEILNALDIVHSDQFYVHPELKDKFKLSVQDTKLSKSILSEIEYEILKKLVIGKTTREIAAENFRSVETIKSHRKRIMKKFDCRNIAELVKYVVENQIV